MNYILAVFGFTLLVLFFACEVGRIVSILRPRITSWTPDKLPFEPYPEIRLLRWGGREVAWLCGHRVPRWYDLEMHGVLKSYVEERDNRCCYCVMMEQEHRHQRSFKGLRLVRGALAGRGEA